MLISGIWTCCDEPMELTPFLGWKSTARCAKCGMSMMVEYKSRQVVDPFSDDDPRAALNEYQHVELQRKWRVNGFGRRYQNGRWSQCSVGETIRRWHQTPDAGIMLSGSMGTGKTVTLGLMMSCLAARNEFSFAFWHVSSLLSFLHGWSGWGEEFNKDEQLRELRNCTYLFLDDLGVEYNSPFAMSRLHEIIEYRYSQEKYFVGTSNLSEGELCTREGWERIIDRIQENALDWLELGGESKRRSYANA